MVKQIYSVYDLKTEFYGPPLVFHNDDEVKRNIAQVMANGKGFLTTNPEDFRLFCIGRFNDSTGDIDTNNPTRLVCELQALKVKENKVE